jgi:hypothetical protein
MRPVEYERHTEKKNRIEQQQRNDRCSIHSPLRLLRNFWPHQVADFGIFSQ